NEDAEADDVTLLRGAEQERYLAGPGSDRTIVLLFGPDSGRVAERASKLASDLTEGDELAVARFEEAELAAEPDSLFNEVYAGSLFADRRVIRIRAGGGRSIGPSLETVLKDPPERTWLSIEAGDLRKSAPLRRICERSPRAVAIGCYPDNDASLDRLIDAELSSANASIEADAKVTLIELLGADRAASRSEVQKLCLFVGPGGVITTEAVATAVGDGAVFAIDQTIDAAAVGDHRGLDRGVRRLLAAGTAASTIGAAAERHFVQLHWLRSGVENGKSISVVLQALRPPVFSSRKAALERQVRLWKLEELSEVLGRIQRAMIESRLHPPVCAAAVHRALIGIAARAAQLSRRRTA
ncbi:MAG: DNA polymerase III subunit delta, partial [Alphaproteobacteria bacterium]